MPLCPWGGQGRRSGLVLCACRWPRPAALRPCQAGNTLAHELLVGAEALGRGGRKLLAGAVDMRAIGDSGLHSVVGTESIGALLTAKKAIGAARTSPSLRARAAPMLALLVRRRSRPKLARS